MNAFLKILLVFLFDVIAVIWSFKYFAENNLCVCVCVKASGMGTVIEMQ